MYMYAPPIDQALYNIISIKRNYMKMAQLNTKVMKNVN